MKRDSSVVTAWEFTPENCWRDAIESQDADTLASLILDHFYIIVEGPSFLKACKNRMPEAQWSEASWRMWVKRVIDVVTEGPWASRSEMPEPEIDYLVPRICTSLHMGFTTIPETEQELFYLQTYVDLRGNRRWHKDGDLVPDDLIEPARSRISRTHEYIHPVNRIAGIVTGWPDR